MLILIYEKEKPPREAPGPKLESCGDVAPNRLQMREETNEF